MRCRNIKPSFFKHEGLADLPPLDRILFLGLLSLADAEGRLLDRPKRIKADILPYDDHDVNAALSRLELVDRTQALPGLIVRYTVGDVACIWIPNFGKHQALSSWEKSQPSEVPQYVSGSENVVNHNTINRTSEELQKNFSGTSTGTTDEGRMTNDEHESDEGRMKVDVVPPMAEPPKRKKSDDGWKRIKLVGEPGARSFEGITDADREEWQSLSPDIDINRELLKVLNREGSHPQWFQRCSKGGRWVATLKAWMMNAQNYAKQTQHSTSLDFRAVERAAEREWQKVMQAGASNDFQKIGFAVAMLHERTVAALKVIDKDPANAVWRMADIPLREQLTFKAAFIPAWKASGIPYEVKE